MFVGCCCVCVGVVWFGYLVFFFFGCGVGGGDCMNGFDLFVVYVGILCICVGVCWFGICVVFCG